MMLPHTRSAFDQDLNELARMIAEMGGLVERQLSQAFDALFEHNLELAEQVIGRDADLDAFERRIEESSVGVIAKRQPMAIDLRETVSALQISHDLERIGDLAKNIGKRAIMLGDERMPPAMLNGLRDMARLVMAQVSAAIDCYARRSEDAALTVCNDDVSVDSLNNVLSSEAVRLMSTDPQQIGPCTQALFCIKNLERAGDHATNIAETVYYIVTGRTPERPRPRIETSLAPAV